MMQRPHTAIACASVLILSLLSCAPGDSGEREKTQNLQQPSETFPGLIARARELGAKYGEAIWPGWADAPFGVLLVEEEKETLFCHGGQATGFTPAAADPATGCDLQTRAREFEPALLASFPVGAGEAMLLEKARPYWRARYFVEPFALRPYFEAE